MKEKNYLCELENKLVHMSTEEYKELVNPEGDTLENLEVWKEYGGRFKASYVIVIKCKNQEYLGNEQVSFIPSTDVRMHNSKYFSLKSMWAINSLKSSWKYEYTFHVKKLPYY